MPENNNEEYKQSWHDEFLKTVCAFANTQGGTLFIGKDDNGNSLGVSDHTRLMETIPQKIKSLLGITAEIILHNENGIHTIEIQVRPYSVAISYHSKYYTRVGSTTTELAGHSLTDFLIKKSGRTWDDAIEDRATLNDIDPNSISSFLVAAKKAGRLPESEGLTKIELLQKLRVADGDKLKRSSIILFGKDPGKFYPNLSVKIGRFRNDSDLDFHEEEEGNLIELLPAVINQLNRKFFTNPIDFEGLQRVE
jgi:ATP-dependent DNA helicase RecG